MAGDCNRKLSFSATSVRESRPSGALNFSPAISSASFPSGVAPLFSTVHLTIKKHYLHRITHCNGNSKIQSKAKPKNISLKLRLDLY
jgi:hypothetical protein